MMDPPADDLGLEAATVRLVPHSPRWATLYQAEVDRVVPFLEAAGVKVSLEHTGSTSVPGLCAKPIIDILAGVAREEDRGAAIGALEGAGYLHRGESGIAGRNFFRRGMPRQFHIHLTLAGSAFWHDHLDFRDWLRANPAAADAYGEVKQALARRFPRDREAYIEGKTAFVEATLRDARS